MRRWVLLEEIRPLFACPSAHSSELIDLVHGRLKLRPILCTIQEVGDDGTTERITLGRLQLASQLRGSIISHEALENGIAGPGAHLC